MQAQPDVPTVSVPSAAQQSDYIDLKVRDRVLAVARILWDGRRTLGQALVAALVAGFLLAALEPRSYEATVRLMPPDTRSSLPLAAGLGPDSASTMLAGANLLGFGLRSSGSLFVGVLKSDTVADRLVSSFGLQRVYGVKLNQDARARLAEHSRISEDAKSGIVSVTVSDRDPARALALARAYVEELDRLNVQLSTSAAHRQRVFIEERLRVVKKELDDAASALSQFSSQNTAIDIREQGRAMVGTAARLEGELIAARSQLTGLEQIYSRNSVRVRELRARIAELERQLDKLGGPGPAELGASGGGDSSSYPSLRQLPLLAAKYGDFYRHAELEQAVFETLTKQSELAKIEEAKELPMVKVLDTGEYPQRSSSLPRWFLVALVVVLSETATAGWLIGKAIWLGVNAQDPVKLFLQEVGAEMRLPTRWFSNGRRWSWLRNGGSKTGPRV